MIRVWLAAAALGGFLSVLAGAAAAHLADGGRAPELLRSGALYGMVHAAVLIAMTAVAQSRGRIGLALAVAGWSFTVGMLLFSLSLFALALIRSNWLGIITPIGGVGLLVGWASLAVDALKRRQQNLSARVTPTKWEDRR
jgi:uncharacterized membrane protein YgdD (TMEM256/DUF423 family)